MESNHLIKKKVPSRPKLKYERERRGWTLEYVATQINCPDSHMVTRWERGTTTPSPRYRQALCELFGKDAEELGLLPKRLDEKPEQAPDRPAPVPDEAPSIAWRHFSLFSSLENATSEDQFFLPAQLTSFVGREQEITMVCELLRRPEVRLLTLTGPGGVGKTRLGVQALTYLAKDFVDGMYFLSLMETNTPNLVVPTIAHKLGLQEIGSQSVLDLLKAFLKEKHLLLLLDNFEQVVEAAPILPDLLGYCPHLKLLVTSRTVLRISGEYELFVPPLALPDLTQFLAQEHLSHYPAIALFLERARMALPNFTLNETNARVIADICVHLDGLPLAIELAAPRLKLLSPHTLLARLDHRLEVLTHGVRNAPLRQQTLRNTLAWSYRLLNPFEQRLFCSLSVFVGGCALEAIEVMWSTLESQQDQEQVLDGVTSLLDKSLLQRSVQEGEEPRLLMLSTIREYGQECLQQSGEVETIQRAHAQYYLALAEGAEAKLVSTEQMQWLKRLEREHENFRAALRWFHDTHDAESAFRIIGGLWIYWLLDHVSEGYQWIAQALSLQQKQGLIVATWVKAKALYAASLLAHYRGDTIQQRAHGKAHLELMRAEGDARGLGIALNFLGHLALEAGDNATLAELTRESLPLLRSQWDHWRLAEALYLSAYSCHWLGEQVQARALAEESLMLFQQIGEPHLTMRVLYALTCIGGDYAAIASAYEEICQRVIKLENITTIVTCLLGIGGTLAAQGQYVSAVRLWGKAKVLYDSVNRTISELEASAWVTLALRIHLGHDQIAMRVLTLLDEQSFTEAWNEGQAMALEHLLERQAIASFAWQPSTHPSTVLPNSAQI